MTQAVNLANFANSLNSSGQLDPANFSSAVSVSKGGTGSTTASGARTNLGLVIGTDVPSPTGSGASGTWSISISGNAATATSATSATNATNATNATYATSSGNASTVTTVTTSQVLAATASASVGGVGTYILATAYNRGSTLTYGETISGTSLRPSTLAFSGDANQNDNLQASFSGTALSGTWRFMAGGSTIGYLSPGGLFLRIS